MNRHYNTAQYRAVAAAVREAFPGAALTTDMMVGFAGETPEDHRKSLDFAREIGFAKIHAFAYSQRPGTRAAAMPNQVPPAEKKRRCAELIAVAAVPGSCFGSEGYIRLSYCCSDADLEKGLNRMAEFVRSLQ